jgi:hypothetical protein
MTVRDNLDKRPWSPEDDALLDKLWNRDKLSHTLIAEVLGRTPAAVMGRTNRKGWASPRLAERAWSQSDLDLIERLWTQDDSLTLEEIAERFPGRTRSAIAGRIQALGLQGKKGPRVTPRARAQPAREAPPPPLSLAPSLPRPVPPPVKPGKVESPAARLWTDREVGQCAYPVKPNGADTWSCCNRTYGEPYCPGHLVVMRPRVGP